MKKLFNAIFEIFDNKMNFSYLKRLGLVISLISIIFITTEFEDINFDLSNLNIEFLILSTFFMLLSYIMFGIAWANYLNKNINLEKKNLSIFGLIQILENMYLALLEFHYLELLRKK